MLSVDGNYVASFKQKEFVTLMFVFNIMQHFTASSYNHALCDLLVHYGVKQAEREISFLLKISGWIKLQLSKYLTN